MSFRTQLQGAADRIKSAGFVIQKIEGQQRNSKTEHSTTQTQDANQSDEEVDCGRNGLEKLHNGLGRALRRKLHHTGETHEGNHKRKERKGRKCKGWHDTNKRVQNKTGNFTLGAQKLNRIYTTSRNHNNLRLQRSATESQIVIRPGASALTQLLPKASSVLMFVLQRSHVVFPEYCALCLTFHVFWRERSCAECQCVRWKKTWRHRSS